MVFLVAFARKFGSKKNEKWKKCRQNFTVRSEMTRCSVRKFIEQNLPYTWFVGLIPYGKILRGNLDSFHTSTLYIFSKNKCVHQISVVLEYPFKFSGLVQVKTWVLGGTWTWILGTLRVILWWQWWYWRWGFGGVKN